MGKEWRAAVWSKRLFVNRWWWDSRCFSRWQGSCACQNGFNDPSKLWQIIVKVERNLLDHCTLWHSLFGACPACPQQWCCVCFHSPSSAPSQGTTYTETCQEALPDQGALITLVVWTCYVQSLFLVVHWPHLSYMSRLGSILCLGMGCRSSGWLGCGVGISVAVCPWDAPRKKELLVGYQVQNSGLVD